MGKVYYTNILFIVPQSSKKQRWSLKKLSQLLRTIESNQKTVVTATIYRGKLVSAVATDRLPMYDNTKVPRTAKKKLAKTDILIDLELGLIEKDGADRTKTVGIEKN